MGMSKCASSLTILQGLLLTTLFSCSRSCNFGPGNLGFFNFGTGNVGVANFGVGNAGLGNKGFLNGGLLNVGFAQLGVRNIGALNPGAVPNTISVGGIPLAPNLTPPLGRRRRRSTMKYPKGKFSWIEENLPANKDARD